MIQLPTKPWNEGDKFTNDSTGVEYTYDGVKWIASGGGEADEATLDFINEVDRTSQMRDEALDSKIDQESQQNTAVHLRLEDQILRSYAWSQGDNEKLENKLTKVDEDLQAQVDTNKTQSESGDRHLQAEIDQLALGLETLLVQREHGQWKYVGFSGDNPPNNAGDFALASDDLSASNNTIVLNQEDLNGTAHGFGDVEIGDYVEIVDLDDPASYVLFVVSQEPSGPNFVNVEVTLKSKGQNILVGETCEIRFFAINEQDINLTDLDNRYLKLSGGAMDGGAVLKVNTLEPVNMPFIYYEGDPDNTHAAGLINRYMMNEHTKQYLPKSGGGMSGGINMNTNHILGVQYLGMTGAKEIQEGQVTRIKLDNKVIVKKAGTNKDGFVLKGGVDGNSDGNLLSVYHNSSGLDSVDYYGKQEGENNLATVGYVNSKAGGGGGSSASAKIQAGIQSWQASRLSEGCFNLLDESNSTTTNCKVARGLTYHTYQSYPDQWPWMKWDLRSGGQIHLTDMNGKYLMSKPVLSVAKYDAGSGDNPADALWFFELSIYGFEAETSLSGLYMVEFENCLEAG